MQTGNVLLALAGDSGNTVPKFGVTPAEVAVLRLIHGDDAVTDVEPTGEIQRTDREERARLADKYGRRNEHGRSIAPAVEALFPGAAARVFHTFEELDMPEELYKPVERVKANRRDPLDHDGDGRKGGSLPQQKAENEAPDFKKMKVEQLVEFASLNHIDLGGETKKAKILGIIEAELEAREAAAGVTDDETVEDDEDGVEDMGDEHADDKLFG